MADQGVSPIEIARQPGVRFKHAISSFAVLHTTNTGLNILYSLALLLALSRVLSTDNYAQIVFFTAMSLYFQPLDQALGRVLFVELRAGVVHGSASRHNVMLLLGGQLLVIIASAVCIPWVVSRAMGTAYESSHSLYLGYALLTNFWAFDLQSTGFALELAQRFVRWSLLHRLSQFFVLGALWLTGRFDVFAMLASGVIVGFTIFAGTSFLKHAGQTSWRWTRLQFRERIGLLGTSILSGLSDLLTLNLPYVGLSLVYGVGAVLVIFDTVMKLARLTMAGSRTLTEIGLPRHSRLMMQGDTQAATRLFDHLVILCVLSSAVPAIIVLFDAPRVFSMLLGPNNLVPAQAGLAVSAVILATGLYQPGSLLMGFANDRTAISRFTGLAALLSFAFVGFVMAVKPEPLHIIWGYAVVLMLLGLGAVALGRRSRSRPVPIGTRAV